MDRRKFGQASLALVGASLPGVWPRLAGASPLVDESAQKNLGHEAAGRWHGIEASVGGRLGVAVLDTATGALAGHRLDERFPRCSTFKVLAAALALARVDAGQERLDRRVAVAPSDLLEWAPVARRHVGASMSVAELCEAAVT